MTGKLLIFVFLVSSCLGQLFNDNDDYDKFAKLEFDDSFKLAAKYEDPHSVELTKDNFDREIRGSKAYFVMFYAPW